MRNQKPTKEQLAFVRKMLDVLPRASAVGVRQVFCLGSKSGYMQFVRVFEVGQSRRLMHSIDRTIKNAYNRNGVNDASIDMLGEL